MELIPLAQDGLVAYASKKTGEPEFELLFGERIVMVGAANPRVGNTRVERNKRLMEQNSFRARPRTDGTHFHTFSEEPNTLTSWAGAERSWSSEHEFRPKNTFRPISGNPHDQTMKPVGDSHVLLALGKNRDGKQTGNRSTARYEVDPERCNIFAGLPPMRIQDHPLSCSPALHSFSR
jgi:hypothetical protein